MAVQAVALLSLFAVLYRPARRVGVVQLWAGLAVFIAGLFVLRGSH